MVMRVIFNKSIYGSKLNLIFLMVFGEMVCFINSMVLIIVIMMESIFVNCSYLCNV